MTQAVKPSHAALDSMASLPPNDPGRGLRAVINPESSARGTNAETASLIYALNTEAMAFKDPLSIAEARCLSTWNKWEATIKEEMSQFKQKGAWDLVDRPESSNITGSC